jgi:hypothetical protein
MLELVEIGAPVVRHGAGIVEPSLVELFDIRGVTPEQIGVGLGI